VTWTDEVTTAAINQSGDIYLADIRDDATVPHVVLEQYAGFVIHELLHRKYTDFSFNSHVPYIRALHNAVEDIWIERKGIAAKVTGNIESLLGALAQDMGNKALAAVTDWSNPAQYPFVLAMHGRTYAPNMPTAAGLAAIFDQACAKIDACRSSADTLAIAEWVFDQLTSIEDAPQKPQNAPTSGEEGEGEGEGAGDSNKPADGSSNKAGDENGAGDEDGVGKAKAPTVQTEPVEVEPTNQAPDEAGGSGSYSENARITQAEDYLRITADKRFTQRPAIPAKLRYEVKRLFENSGSDEFNLKRKTGALNVHALPSFATGSVDLFKRRQEVEGIDSAVIILLDVSGSMFDDHNNKNAERMIAAIQTTQALLETLNKAGVKTAVLTFGSYTTVIKGFDMPALKAVPLLERIKDGGSTNDYFAIRYAHKLLLQRPEQRKVVFSITDGDGHRRKAKAQVQSGERLGITTIGVGIQHDVSGVYPKHVNIQNVADLGSASFKQIKLAA
jgi:cobalamin biosynthesis protein CobT